MFDTIFDAHGNMNLYYVNDRMEVYETKAIWHELDMRPYLGIYGHRADAGLLLNSVIVPGETPAEYYDLMFHGVSLVGLSDPAVTFNNMKDFVRTKARFFASIRERGMISAATNIGYKGFHMSDLTAAFNPGSLALASIPAYMVLALTNALELGEEGRIGRGVYNTMAPPRTPSPGAQSIHLNSWEDYLDAFHHGNFLWNDSDLFLTTYGLAKSIRWFADEIEHTTLQERERIENILLWEPLIVVWNDLVSMGALRNPFVKGWGSWKQAAGGAENAEELNPDLLATLQLADALSPVPPTPVTSFEIRSVFYGLIKIFHLHDYFGIDNYAAIRFPEQQVS